MLTEYGHLSARQLGDDIAVFAFCAFIALMAISALLRPTFGIQPRGKGK